ncbi:MAG: sigma-70 family RNA polymerase sigma factor [Lapillicoccus sp.]
MAPLDEDVVADIYREHAPALRRFVGRTSVDQSRVDDVVQEAIMRVWRQAPEVTSMRAYLFQTTRNILIDMHRAAGRRVVEVAEDRDDDSRARVDPRATNPAVEIDRALDQILVEDALARLQPDHRDVVVALYYRRLTVVEAAAALGIPAGTVKSRAHYAVRSLRAILDEMGVTQ